MAKRDSYAPGTPSWTDLATSDQAAAKSFYGDLFGWSFNDLPVGDGVFYSMATLKGDNVAAISPQQPAQVAAGVTPHWQIDVTVADVGAASALVVGARRRLAGPASDRTGIAPNA